MRLLDLVEQDDAVRSRAQRRDQQPLALVAHVSRRRADQLGHRVRLGELGHVEADQPLSLAEQHLGQASGQLGLAHSGRPEEQEAPHRTVRVLEAGARSADGGGHCRHGLVLADHPNVQLVLEMHQLVHLALEQPGDRHAGPLGYNGGDLFLADLLVQHRPVLLQFGEPSLLLFELALQLGNRAVA